MPARFRPMAATMATKLPRAGDRALLDFRWDDQFGIAAVRAKGPRIAYAESLDAAIIFTPIGDFVPLALRVGARL